MTYIIFNRFNTNSFSLIQFYFSRFNRIAPALLTTVIVFFIVFYFLLFSNELKNYIHSLKYVLSFSSNIYFYLKAIDYFKTSVYSQYLLHTWSLSVEFQFYILYPLVLLICKRYLPTKTIKYVVLALFIISLGYSLIESSINSRLSYYILSTRAWQLLAGAICYLFPFTFKSYNKLLHYIFFFSIILCTIFIKSDTAWPNFYSIIPILLTMCFLYTNNQNTFLVKNKILNYIGKISYSLYLYHWPTMIIYTFLYNHFTIIKSFYFIIISFILASLSYHLVEKRFNKKLSAILYFVVWLLLILGSNSLESYKHLPKKIEKDLYKHYKPKISKVKSNHYILLVGDSFAERTARVVNELNNNTLHYNLIVQSVIRCYYDNNLMGYRLINNPYIKQCETSTQKFRQLLQKDSLKGYTFIWNRRWELWVKKEDNYFYSLNNKKLDSKKISKKEFEKIVSQSINDTLKTLNNKGAKVILILQVPRQNVDVVDLYLRNFRFHLNEDVVNKKLKEASVSREDHLKMQKDINTHLIKIANKYKNVTVFNPTSYMCDEEKCLIGTAKQSFYMDKNHISTFSGMEKLKKPLSNLIIKQQ